MRVERKKHNVETKPCQHPNTKVLKTQPVPSLFTNFSKRPVVTNSRCGSISETNALGCRSLEEIK
jgi:hypothetical protein